MMTALFIFGAMSVLGFLFVVAAGAAARRPMPEFAPADESVEFDVYRVESGRSRPRALLLPAVSH